MILYILLKGEKMEAIILSLILMNITIFVKRRDIFLPVFIYNSVWLISAVCTFVLIKKLDIVITYNTQFIIILSTLFFNIPFFINTSQTIGLNKKKIILDISFFIQIIILLVTLFFIYILYQEIYKISILSGNASKSISSILSYSRYGRTHENITFGRKVANILRLNYALCTVCGMVLVNKILYKTFKKKDILLIIIIVFSTGICIFSGGRVDIINQLIILVGIYIIEYTKIYKKNLRLLKIVLIITIILVLLFILQGIFLLNRIEKTQILDNIYLYLGSPIVALNEYLNGRVGGIKNLYFGSNTFLPIYGFISHFINIENNLEFFPPIEIMKSNVYTSIFPYLVDFGIIGMLVVQFLKGLIFKKIYFSILKNGKLGIYYFLFLSILPTIIFSFFDEMLTRKINSIIVIVAIEFIIFKIFIKKKFFLINLDSTDKKVIK